MSYRVRPECGFGKTTASLVLAGLVLCATASQADTVASATGEALPDNTASNYPISIWVDAAPLSMVIRQLASLSGRAARIEEPAETEELTVTGEVADDVALAKAEEAAESDAYAKAGENAEVLVSGRFSGSLGDALAQLSADYPVTFDLDDETLYAMSVDVRPSVSIAMLSTPLEETFRNELLASAVAGNSVEFREDSVRVTGHPAFVKRQTGFINKMQATAEARLNADSLKSESMPAGATSMADSGSAEVLIDIQDEIRPPAEQANLSKPIRWVTDIPGFHTF